MTAEPQPSGPRRVMLVADEFLGLQGGGLGTATAFLALALARMGHDVEVLYVGAPTTAPVDREWGRAYAEAAVRIRNLPHGRDRVEPSYFTHMRDVDHALGADPPDVVITQDLAAPAYVALRRRQLGLAYGETLFVVYCHGTRRWIADASRKVRVLPGALAVSVLEQASIELADVAVSPSAYMVNWMREQGWQLPASTTVIPLFTRSAATGETHQEASQTVGGPVRRIAFFGRLEERKGVRPFVAGVNAVDQDLLHGVALAFVGMPWTITPAQIETALSAGAKRALHGLTFETSLVQHEALALLSEPGTVAVMPSLEDNSPATVYECLERSIPFVASNAGGTAELIAPQDHARVLFEPTAAGVATALRRVLEADTGFAPAHPAFTPAAAYEGWASVLATSPRVQETVAGPAEVDVVSVPRDPPAREEALHLGDAPWVVLLDEEDVPDERLVELLTGAQQASGADIVTCGVRLHAGDGQPVLRFFLGEPGALGVLANDYGTVALIRRSLLDGAVFPPARDPDWPLLAGLSLAGAKIVSIPEALVTRRVSGVELRPDSSDALRVVELFEQQLPDPVRALPRLAAGLAESSAARPRRSVLRRGLARFSRSLAGR